MCQNIVESNEGKGFESTVKSALNLNDFIFSFLELFLLHGTVTWPFAPVVSYFKKVQKYYKNTIKKSARAGRTAIVKIPDSTKLLYMPLKPSKINVAVDKK